MASLLTSLVGFTVPGEVLIYLRDEQTRSHLTVKNAKDRFETLPLFYDGENVSGKVRTKRLCEACVDSLACGVGGVVLGCGMYILACGIGIVVGMWHGHHRRDVVL